jgi:hypothetical protein
MRDIPRGNTQQLHDLRNCTLRPTIAKNGLILWATAPARRLYSAAVAADVPTATHALLMFPTLALLCVEDTRKRLVSQ